MKKFKFLVLLLAFIMLFSACGSNGASTDTDTGTETTVQDTKREVRLTENKRASYKIILPESCDGKIAAAAEALKNKLKDATGAFFTVADDHTRNDEVIESTGEIIIGDCKRVDMQAMMSTLKYRDYAVEINDSNILIAGHETAKIVDAIYSFMKFIDEDYIDVSNGSAVLNWDGNYQKLHTSYKFENMTLGGVPLSEYRIVYPSNSGAEEWLIQQAKIIKDSIGRRSGYVLPICSDAVSAQAYEILLGKTNRTESTEYYATSNAPAQMEYAISVSNAKLMLASGGFYTLSNAVNKMDTFISSSKDGALDAMIVEKTSLMSNVPACVGDYRFMNYNVMADLDGYWYEGGVGRRQEVDIRKEIVAGLVCTYRPTVIAFEEVFENWYAQLSEELAGSYAFVPLRIGATVNRTMLAYDPTQVKLIDHGYETAEKVASINNRCIAWALFEDLQSGQRFATFACHFSVTNEADRVEEAKLMVQVINTVKESYNVPIIAMGDYNSREPDDASKTFLKESGLNRAISYSVDHIYCGNGFVSCASGVETENHAVYASDHWSIWADIELNLS